MPLTKGSSRSVIGNNISEMEANGHPHDQAVAAALRVARESRASGGRAEGVPSEAQKEAGNYKKRKINFHGLLISIENEKGSMRSGVGPTGHKWSCKIPADYGYVRGTEGADGDHVDCYVGPHKDSHVVFVVDQKDPRTGKFDEHKCLLGFRDEKEARKVYEGGFSDGSGPKRLGHMTTMSLGMFKDWLRTGKTKKPMNSVEKALRVARAAGGSVTDVFTGPIHSSVGGRTDHLPAHTPSGAYVIPADIVSAYGEGNTMAGFKVLRRLFGGQPYDKSKEPYSGKGAPYNQTGDTPYGGDGGPYNENLEPHAKGGETKKVPVVVAGGEYILHPEQVRAIGKGDLDTGHAVLDEFVKRSRKDLIKTLSKLPPPKKD